MRERERRTKRWAHGRKREKKMFDLVHGLNNFQLILKKPINNIT